MASTSKPTVRETVTALVGLVAADKVAEYNKEHEEETKERKKKVYELAHDRWHPLQYMAIADDVKYNKGTMDAFTHSLEIKDGVALENGLEKIEQEKKRRERHRINTYRSRGWVIKDPTNAAPPMKEKRPGRRERAKRAQKTAASGHAQKGGGA